MFASESNVLGLLKKHYNIVPNAISKAKGYVNVNYLIRIESSEGEMGGRKKETRYIAKVVDKSHESYCGNTGLQHAMMAHLGEHGILSSQPVVATDGNTFLECVSGVEEYTFQVLTFVDGQTLNESALTAEEYSKISYEIGKYLGNLHEVLKTLDYDTTAASKVTSPFHTENALGFKKLISRVENVRSRDLITKYLDLFEKNFLPKIPELRKTFLHGDFSDANLILEKYEKEWKVEGVIDFEECYYGCLVGELGICTAYCMMKSAAIPDSNPVEISGLVLRGYRSVLSLTAVEQEVLFEAVLSRLCASYVSAWHEVALCPENEEHIFSQAVNVPPVFEVIQTVGRKRIEEEWFGKK